VGGWVGGTGRRRGCRAGQGSRAAAGPAWPKRILERLQIGWVGWVGWGGFAFPGQVTAAARDEPRSEVLRRIRRGLARSAGAPGSNSLDDVQLEYEAGVPCGRHLRDVAVRHGGDDLRTGGASAGLQGSAELCRARCEHLHQSAAQGQPSA
jgi:hypothetical protein